jgi:ribonuclease P protein component
MNRPDYRLPRESRIKAARLFQEIYEQGRSLAGSFMILRVRTGTNVSLRLGVAAGRKIGGAVKRNFAKRRLRETLRLNRHLFRDGCDVIATARPEIIKAPWQEVQAELIALAGKAGILKEETTDLRLQTSDLKTNHQKSDV